MQAAPKFIKDISTKICQSKFVCRVVASGLILTLFMASIGNLVSE